MVLAGDERETQISFNEVEEKAEVYTSSKRVAERMLKAGLEPVKVDMMGEEAISWWFEVPKVCVRLKVKRRGGVLKVGGGGPLPD